MADENKLLSATHLERLNSTAPILINKEQATSVTSTSNSQARPRPELGTVEDTYLAPVTHTNTNATPDATPGADTDGEADGDPDASDGYGAKSPEGNYITYSTGEPEHTSPPAHHSQFDRATSEEGEDKEAPEEVNVRKPEYSEVPDITEGKDSARRKAAKDTEDGSDDDYDGEANDDESDVEEEYEDDGLSKDEVVPKQGTRGGLRSSDKK